MLNVLDLIDEGNNSIVHSQKMTDFVYGKDFTYDNGKITWLEQESETCEPESYTVSFSEDTSVNYSVSGTKKSVMNLIDKSSSVLTIKRLNQ